MLNKLTTAQKALAGFVAALLMVVAIAVVAWLGNRAVQARVMALSEVEFPAAEALREINEVQNAADEAVSSLLHRRLDARMRQDYYANLDASLKRVEDGRRAAAALPQTPERAAAWADVQAKLAPWIAAIREATARIREREAIAAGEGDPRYAEAEARAWQAWMVAHERSNAADEALDRAQEETRRAVKAAQASADQAAGSAGATLLAALAVAAAFLLALAFMVQRSITRVVRGLVGEAKRLTESVDRGELAVRGDPAAVAIEFQPVVEGMNRTVDAFARPIRLNDGIARKFGNGEVPDLVTEEFHGEFDVLKRNWNAVVESTRMRSADLERLMQAALEGRLDVRADASKYKGYNGKLVEAMNAILDAIATPLAEAAAVLERLSSRDLTARMTGSYRGEYARMQEAVNGTAQALHDALAQVATSTEQLSGAAAQITSSSQGVAQAAAGQASSIEETSSQLEEMAGMAKGSADNAQQASALAQSARAAAAQGSDAMAQMGGAMVKIRASAEGTSQIIKDINEIAFQTNLLALNAAVEAARAGDAGRGFAVVAEEVRSLAMRSKEAANKTEALIQESVRQTGEGGATAKLVGEKLSEITTMVRKVSDIVGEIAAAAREQAASIDQLTAAMSEGSQATQTFAAAAEESSSASLEMSAQSAELAKLVSEFRLEGGAAARPPTSWQRLAPARPAAGNLRRASMGHGATGGLRAKAPKPPGANAANGKKSAGANGFALRPEDMIPLDGDPQFKDF